MEKYDLIVIGSGPAGEKAAVKAAYFGKRVAIIEKEKRFGGAGINTGTLPSKTLKETALFFSGKYEKGLFGVDRTLKHQATVDDFMFRKNYVVTSEGDEVHRNLNRHRVDIYKGIASFEDSHTVKITGEASNTIYGESIIIATGSYPFHPQDIPFDGKRVHDSDTILDITRIPQSICIVGAGVIGCEYVTIFATMGSKVYLINRTDAILPFIDKEITSNLIHSMEKDDTEILFNESVKSINLPDSDREFLRIGLESGKWLHVDMFLFAAGRNGNTKDLQCEKAGITVGKREQLTVDDHYRTNVPHIYAVGDVIGFPALASTSMDQGRVAVTHIFNTGDLDNLAKVIPYGIYTVPEVSMVGVTEEEAIEKKMNYCVGRARYGDMARGKIMGAVEGIMKIIFTRDDLVVRGVHVIGPLATEIIHYGLSLVENKKTVMHVISTVFNYPTLHDLYKYASYDGLGNLSGHKVKD
ncbi:MAG: Si-specific NAD(P)(+) transhydrogenase [Chlamydiales bacterium]|nr:Si-specific NAD(P)(+) transhydrogenase [Chlamydiales bacterium]